MGSLAVLMKIGLFQLDGGTTVDPVYQIGSPVFDRIEIAISPDYYPETFVIETRNTTDQYLYPERSAQWQHHWTGHFYATVK